MAYWKFHNNTGQFFVALLIGEGHARRCIHQQYACTRQEGIGDYSDADILGRHSLIRCFPHAGFPHAGACTVVFMCRGRSHNRCSGSNPDSVANAVFDATNTPQIVPRIVPCRAQTGPCQYTSQYSTLTGLQIVGFRISTTTVSADFTASAKPVVRLDTDAHSALWFVHSLQLPVQYL